MRYPLPKIDRAPIDGRSVARAFQSWASERGFEEGAHDAELRGVLDDVEVVIDTGVRDSGAWPARVQLGIASGERPLTLRAGDPDQPGDGLRVRRLRAVARARAVTLWVDPDRITIPRASSDPDDLEDAVRDVIGAWRAGAAEGVYR